MQALGLMETKGLIAAIESADAMLKAADVNLLERTFVGGGLVSIVVTGDVGAVKASVEAGAAAVRKINSALLVSEHVIPRPHQELDNMIVSAIPLKDVDISTVPTEKTRIEEDTAVDSFEGTVVEDSDASFENVDIPMDESTKAESEEEIAVEAIEENTVTSIKSNQSKSYNKEAVDKMILEQGLEETIKVLNKFKVIELRNLAREYKNFGITGRKVSKADKRLLLTEFRKYYGNN